MAQMIFFAQMKYNLVAQMKYCIFQKLAQMQYTPMVYIFSGARRDRMVVGFITTYAISSYHH
jgi:hypothetical protein